MHIQAGTVMGGTTLCSRPYSPKSIRRRMFDKRSSPKMTSGAAQSNPKMQIFIMNALEQRFSLHGFVTWNAQILQNRRSHVQDLGMVVSDRPIHKKHARNRVRIHYVVSAPPPGVVFEQGM